MARSPVDSWDCSFIEDPGGCDCCVVVKGHWFWGDLGRVAQGGVIPIAASPAITAMIAAFHAAETALGSLAMNVASATVRKTPTVWRMVVSCIGSPP